MQLEQQRKRRPWGLVVLLVFFTIYMIFQVQVWIEKPRQTKPITYLFDQPVSVPVEASEDWLRGAVWIKPRLLAWSAAFSPDGEFIAVPMGFGVIGIFRAQDGSLVRMLAGHKRRIEWVDFSPDGRFLASGEDDGKEIRLWSLATGETVQRFPCKSLCGRAAFSPDGRWLAFGYENTLKMWEIETGQERAIPTGYLRYKNFVEFSDDGQLIASGSFFIGDTVRVWRVSDGAELFTIKKPAFGPVRLPIGGFSLSIGGSLLASATPDGVIKLWRLPEGSLVRTISAHRKAQVPLPPKVLFSPQGDLLVSSYGGTIKLWSPEGRFLGRLNWQAGMPLVFSPDGKYLASGSATLKLWQISDKSLKLNLGGVYVFRRVWEGIESLAFSPDGTLLATSYPAEGVKLWQMPEGRLVGMLPTSGYALAFSPDGQLLAVAETKAIKLWRVKDGKRVRSLSCGFPINRSLAFSPDGTLLAAVCADRLEVWKVSDGSKLFIPRIRGTGIAFSPDSELLAVNGKNGVMLYNARDGKEVRTLLRSRYCPVGCAVAFSSDGQLVAASIEYDNGSYGIKIWKVSDGQEVRSYQAESRYSNPIQAVAFVPSKKVLAIAEGSTIKLWDLESDEWVGSFQGHTSDIATKIKALAISPDGKYLASGGDDGVALWQIRTE